MSGLIKTITGSGSVLFIARDKINTIYGEDMTSMAEVTLISSTDPYYSALSIGESVQDFVRKYEEAA